MQALHAEMISNIKTLSTLKKSGYKVGKLKFRREVNSIPLKQYNATHKIISNKKLKIQGVKGHLLVNGLKQLPEKYEVANAKILNTPSGYYVAITIFVDNVDKIKKEKIPLGVDFGCATTLTCSNGEKFDVKIQESDRLKRLQRKLSRQVKRSKGYDKTRTKIRKEYQKMKNVKIDKTNKISHYLLDNYDIYMQDENISGWAKTGNGRSVQHSILGMLKAKLKPNASSVLDRYVPTTKYCYNCGNIKESMPTNIRKYECDCGVEPEDRDIHAAKNMIFLVGQELTEFTPVDNMTTTANFDVSSKFSCMKPEDSNL